MPTIAIVGLDIAKNVFQVHGADADGAPVLRRQIRRGQVLSVFRQPPAVLWSRSRPVSPLISGRGRSPNTGMRCG